MMRFRWIIAGDIRLDNIVKAQFQPLVIAKSGEGSWFGRCRIEDRQDMGHSAPAVAVKFVQAANRQGGEGGEFHAGSRNTKAEGPRSASTAGAIDLSPAACLLGSAQRDLSLRLFAQCENRTGAVMCARMWRLPEP